MRSATPREGGVTKDAGKPRGLGAFSTSSKVSIALVLRLGLVLGFLAASLPAQEEFINRETRTRVDYQSGLVYYEEWVEGFYNGVTKVESLDAYLARLGQSTLSKSWQDAVQQEQLGEDLAFDRNGLIPEINLPVLPLFGSGSKIDIAGSDRITLGGSNTVLTGTGGSDTAASFLPQLNMKQDLKINLNGSIGDKTKIFLDHDSERQLEAANKIRLSYEGSEDDIVQSIEAGDTRLTIPSTGYTGDLPAHNGLFGVSARGRLGGVDVYGIAAREQSESQSQEFNQLKQAHLDTIWDSYFLRYTRFRLDTIPLPDISDLHVYVDDGNLQNTASKRACLGTVFPDHPDSVPANWDSDRKVGSFALWQPNKDYFIPRDNSYIEFVTPILDNYAVGVTYKRINGHDTILVGGQVWRPDTIVVKLLKPGSSDTASLAWNLEIKNLYGLSSKDVRIDSIFLYQTLPGRTPDVYTLNGRTFLNLVGLDPQNNNTVQYPQFDAQRGYLICDSLYPFIARSLDVPDSIYKLRFPSSYDHPRYFFRIIYSTSSESYSLGATDIIENSEKVYVNDQLKTKDVNYTINYATGEVTFKEVLPSDARVRVTYEYTPLFSASQKSLVGARAEWKFLDNARLGSSIFYRDEAIPGEDRPSLGSEPFQRTVAESDFGYDLSSDFITSLLDRLPLVRAEAPTAFHFGGEGAVSMPNPNTRNAAYLDDFEGSTVSRDMNTANALWHYASVPADRDTHSFAQQRVVWFNPTTRILKESIFGKNIGDEAKDPVDYLKIAYTPNGLNTWAGIMTCQYALGMNVSDLENVEAVLRTRHNQGVIHVTLGTSIDEDAPRRRKDGTIAGFNGHEDTEDRPPRNGMLDDLLGEDCGLDGVAGADNVFPNAVGDDGNDDFDRNNPLANPDGTEGNKRLDGEDLMGTGWTQSNRYYEYTFRFDDTVAVKPLVNGWKTLRVSLFDPTRSKVVGSPRLEEIRMVRIWFDSFPGTDTIDLYSLSVVGSKWRNPTVESLSGSAPVDTVIEHMRTSLISVKTDPNYTSPFALQKDPLTGKSVLEASLKLDYEAIKPGHRGIARKTNIEHDDYRDYRSIRTYVHKDPTTNPVFFLQFGSDSVNYYEVRQAVTSMLPVAGHPDWYEAVVSLDSLAQLKYALGLHRDTFMRLDYFTICGNPSLSDVRYMGMGVENSGSEGLTGNVWVDDIRLTSPRQDVGLGFNAAAGITLSDLGSFSVNYRYDDPNFRRFSEGRGVKTGGYSNAVGYGLSANLDRFFPASWALSLPLSYSYSSARTIPKYSSTYPDLRLPANRVAEETGENLSSSWSINARKNRSANKLLNYTLEALGYSFNHRQGSSVSLLDKGSMVSDAHSLDYSISPDLKFKIGSTEISYFPSSIHFSGSLSNAKSPSYHRDTDSLPWTLMPAESSNALSYDYGADYSPVNDLDLSYSLSADRDLTDQNKFNGINIGQESNRDGSFSASYSLDIGDFLSPKADFDGHYTEDRIRLGTHYDSTRNVQNGGDLDLSSDLDLPEALGAIGKLRDESRDSAARAGSPQWLLARLENAGDVLSPVDLSYSITRSSSYNDIIGRPPLWYQLGFTDAFNIDSLHPPTASSQELGTDFSASTEFRVKILEARLRYGRTWSRDISGFSPTGNLSTAWPDISLSLSKVEGILPKLLTSSSISSGYQVHSDFTGTYVTGTDTFDHVGRSYTTSTSLSPLFSWQANWVNKLNSTFAANYTRSLSQNYLEAEQATSSTAQNQSYSLNLGYSFSAPSGIKLFGLRTLKFTSDLSVNLGLTYARSQTTSVSLTGETSPLENSSDLGTTVSLSYRFSRSIEAGLNSGYTVHNNIQQNMSARTTDLNIWVLFKF